MHCDHQLVNEHLLDYIEDSLSPAVKKQVDNAIDRCENCRQVYRQAISVQQAAFNWQESEVPAWHRTEFAVRPKPKLQNWLSWTSLATSTLAILMVLFQVQFAQNPDGFSVAFGGNNAAKVDQLVEQRLLQYQQRQTALLDARLLAQNEKLGTAHKLAMVDLLDKTRAERREDMSFLVTGIQTQRFEDLENVDNKLTMLADNQIENNQYLNQIIQSANSSKGENP